MSAESSKVQDSTGRKNRITLLFLVLVFASPPMIGWIVYLNPELIPEGSTNRGQLIEPPVSLRQLQTTTTDGQTFDWNRLDDLWTLIVISANGCNTQCEGLIAKTIQIRRAIGANRLRIASVLIMLNSMGPDPAAATGSPDLITESLMTEGEIRVLHAGDASAAARAFNLVGNDAETMLYIMDTRGFLMMRHNMSELTPQDVIEDLEVLLKASANWKRKP